MVAIRNLGESPTETGPIEAIMSIDLEDWFQVENLKGAIPRTSWATQEYRVVQSTEHLLEIFAETNTSATFFCLGWVAERSPELIRRIHAAGHEIASHGFDHVLVYDQDSEVFRTDVVRAKALLEDICGDEVLGYRAPSFSITPWGMEILAETGHRYDSSVFPISGHDRYASVPLDEKKRAAEEDFGVAPVYRLPTESGEMIEVPIATRRVAGRTVPWGGGGYFRLIPQRVFARGFRRGIVQRTAPIFYLHPWELDQGQPRIATIKRSYAFRHYTNLEKTATRLTALCKDVAFERADVALRLR